MASTRHSAFQLTAFTWGYVDEKKRDCVDEEGSTRRFRVPPELLQDSGSAEDLRPSGVRRGPAGRETLPRPCVVEPSVSQRTTALARPAVRQGEGLAPPRRALPPPLPASAFAPRLAVPAAEVSAGAHYPCVARPQIGRVFSVFHEHVGLVAPWLFKQALLQRRYLPSTVPVGQLGSLVDQLAMSIDSPEAKSRFRESLSSLSRADTRSRESLAAAKKVQQAR